jgi:hypothetical protein
LEEGIIFKQAWVGFKGKKAVLRVLTSGVFFKDPIILNSKAFWWKIFLNT